MLMVTPWQNLGRIVGFLPMVYAAWWKKSIYVSTAVHVLGNVTPWTRRGLSSTATSVTPR